ncbi:MAG: hypothetical protein R2832_03980 [Rhodothermales bacterium]
MENVDVLYHYFPFEKIHAPLAAFSMATKLVTYLGSGMPILFHGPKYAAAADLLRSHAAAILVGENDPQLIAERFPFAEGH